jgi:hypothetical protein
MRIRKREKLPQPIHLGPGDSISITENGRELLREQVGRHIRVDEVASFDVAAGEIPGAVQGIGGVLLQTTSPWQRLTQAERDELIARAQDDHTDKPWSER